MPNVPFRFLHAADLHLERPLMGVADVPDHLRDLFLDAPYTAAQRVFDAAIAEGVRFVVLGGGIVTPAAGPRGPIFLAEQFTRLAQRGIEVFWAGSPIDPPEIWPSAVRLPSNVHFFPRGRVESVLISGDEGPLVRVVGTSCDPQRPWRPEDFAPDAAGLYTVAVVHGEAEVSALLPRGIDYWAMGGRHDRETPYSGPLTIHYSGTTQGRRPEEAGSHGCTLVQVDSQRQARTSMIPTDAARWIGERVAIDAATTRDDLASRLRERIQALVEATPGAALLVSWTVAGSGPLATALRRGALAAELLESLRADFGHRQPAAWSLSLAVELPETLPPEWYEQETIRGDFLRAVRQWQMNPDDPLSLEQFLAESHRAGTLAAAVEPADAAARGEVLREAAALGVDLLSGEERDA